MTTFIGDYTCKVDAKGRVVFPSAFKKQMKDTVSYHFVVKKDIFEKCLVIYPIEEWERQNKILRSILNPYNKEHSRFLRGFYKGTAEIILDASSRMLIPKRLLELAEIDKDVYLAGQDTKIEIWSKELYEQFGEDDEDFAMLAQEILGNNAFEITEK